MTVSSQGYGFTRLALVATVTWSWLSVTSPARGAPAADQADALFQAGLAEMQAGNHEAGCPKLEASYRLDPVPGALFTLAECEAARGRGATALAHYQSFVNLLPTLPAERRESFDERRGVALERIAALGAVVPELTIDVSPDAPAELSVRRNGEPVEPTSYGVARKVDPGDYILTAELHGEVVWQRRVVLAERDRARFLVPGRAPAPRPSSPPPRTVPIQREEASPGGDGPSRIPLYAAIGLGVSGVVVGSVAGIVAVGKKDSIERNCPGRACNPEGRRALDGARRAATVSTLGFAAAGVGGAAALVLVLVSPDSSPERSARGVVPRIVSDGRGVGLMLEGWTE
jgi:hypothetical protein